MVLEFVSYLYQKKGSLIHDFDYCQLVEDKELIDIAPQIFAILKESGQLGDIPEFFRKRIKEEFLEVMALNLFVKREIIAIFKVFEEFKIEIIPLKGVYFAERFFGHIGARRTTDIDILIKPEQLQKAEECIRSLGFGTREQVIDGHFHWSYSKPLPGSAIPLVVELHWDLVCGDTAEMPITDIWETAQPLESYCYVKELTDYYTFYMICLHAWRHNLDSLKYYLDIIQVLMKSGGNIDFHKMLKDAAHHKTLNRLNRTLSSVYLEFPLVDSIKIIPIRKRHIHLSYLEKKKSKKKFGFKKYIDYIDYQFFSYDSWKDKLKQIQKRY